MAHEKLIPLFQQLVDCLDVARRWKGIVKLRAQKMNLQGEKRRNRYGANKCHALRQSVQTLAMDLLGLEIIPTEKPVAVANFTSYKEYFEALKEHLWWFHDTLHELANKFVVDDCCFVGNYLHKMCKCIFEEAIAVNREIHEGEAYGWSEHLLFMKQIHKENIHDHYEELEDEPW